MIFLSAIALAGAPAAFDHDHTAFDRFLEGAVDDNGVDYDTLATRRDLLDTYLASLASADVGAFDKNETIAFWTNAYNANTLAVVLDNRPLDSIRDLNGGNVWSKRTFEVGGQTVTLDEMEHGRLRPLADGRIHAVVNCASKGCPPLPVDPIVPTELGSQLDEATRRWARTNAYVKNGDDVALNKIFKWYAEDFEAYEGGDLPGVEGPKENALWFIGAFVDKTESQWLTAQEHDVSWADYDWSLNSR